MGAGEGGQRGPAAALCKASTCETQQRAGPPGCPHLPQDPPGRGARTCTMVNNRLAPFAGGLIRARSLRPRICPARFFSGRAPRFRGKRRQRRHSVRALLDGSEPCDRAGPRGRPGSAWDAVRVAGRCSAPFSRAGARPGSRPARAGQAGHVCCFPGRFADPREEAFPLRSFRVVTRIAEHFSVKREMGLTPDSLKREVASTQSHGARGWPSLTPARAGALAVGAPQPQPPGTHDFAPPRRGGRPLSGEEPAGRGRGSATGPSCLADELSTA